AILIAPAAGAAIAAEIESFRNREVRKYAAPFRHVNKPAADDRGRRLALDGAAGELDGATRCAKYSRDSAVQRRFSRTVGAQDRDDLASNDGKFDVAQDLGGAVTGGKAADGEERLSHGPLPPRRGALPRHGRDRPRSRGHRRPRLAARRRGGCGPPPARKCCGRDSSPTA